ncbi:MAG: TraR/DksA family transcriptional regulator [Planctomycetota bacterium]
MAKKLPKRDLEFFRNLLLEKRSRLSGNLTSVSKSAEGAATGSGDAADLGTEASETETLLSLLENNTSALREIDKALERIDEGTYGICDVTGEPIGRERLKAIPWTRFSIEAQRAMESGGSVGLDRGSA